jgi:hypothetical protein
MLSQLRIGELDYVRAETILLTVYGPLARHPLEEPDPSTTELTTPTFCICYDSRQVYYSRWAAFPETQKIGGGHWS